MFFYGPYFKTGGPYIVNRGLIRYFDKFIKLKKRNGRISSFIEALIKISTSKTIIFSGLLFHSIELKYAKLLNKKIIYLMHGCSRLETGKINDKENEILKLADQIICVSNLYKDLMAHTFPEYEHKFAVVHNGIDWEKLSKIQKYYSFPRQTKRIILFGGGRKFKHNLEVCKAVDLLNKKYNTGLQVCVYGHYRETDDSIAISSFPFVSFNDIIPQEQVNQELLKSGIFIQNSTLESFGLGVIDAIALGCNVLFSKNVGAQEIVLGKTQMDIINDPSDIEEIMSKIYNLLEHPNNERLVKSIDTDATTIKEQVKRIISICTE